MSAVVDTQIKPYYSDEAVTLYLGDCFDVMPALFERGESVDVAITDPPYSDHTHSKQWIGSALTADAKPRVSTAHKELGFDPITPTEMLNLCVTFSAWVNRWSLIFCDIESIADWRGAVEASPELQYVRACIWDKVDSAPQFTGDRPAASAEAIICAHMPGRKRWNGGGARNVFRHAVNGTAKGAKPHPSTKPLSLMRELVYLFTEPEEVILDPFAGSGSTLIAAKSLGRRAIGLEREERWCEVAAQRLEREARQKPLDFRATQEAMSFT